MGQDASLQKGELSKFNHPVVGVEPQPRFIRNSDAARIASPIELLYSAKGGLSAI
jgi:hypothetical protein